MFQAGEVIFCQGKHRNADFIEEGAEDF